MKFDIITIFPDIFCAKDASASGEEFYGYFGESIIKRARKKDAIDIKIHNLRAWASDKHKTVDDTPYGGGAGMVMKVETIYKAVNDIKKSGNSRTILFSAKGKKYTQKDAKRLAKYDNLILICGRYEGVDERVAKYIADEEISIGDYVLTGGEIPAMVVVDSVTRLLPGVLGNPESLTEESFNQIPDTSYKIQNTNLEYPQYTKPENFQGWKVPEILLSGNHKKIREWREKNSKKEL